METENDWSDYGFDMLFSPDSDISYLPVEEQIGQYKTRDLEKSKMYVMATKLWGLGARSRRRIITAPPMADKPKLSFSTTQPLKPKDSDGALSSQTDLKKKSGDWALSEKEQEEAHDEKLEERTSEYKHWYQERVKLREGLENLGLSEKWLKKKNDLTPLEQRVCEKLERERKEREAAKLKQIQVPHFHWQNMTKSEGRYRRSPKVNKPIPEGLVIIVRYLSRRRQRILDLFARADKDKNWKISRSEFKGCILEAGIPISEELLNEAIDNLDTDGDDVVDYRELVTGVKGYKLMEREKAKSQQTSKVSASLEIPTPTTHAVTRNLHSPKSSPARGPVATKNAPRSTSGLSDRTTTSSPATSTGSSHLALPKTDMTEMVELLPDDMVEKRKKEKHLTACRTSRSRRNKRAPKIKTGNTAIDNHSLNSTLGGDIGKAVDSYREARLKEYHQICQLCAKNEVPLTPELLQRAILHPGDKPHKKIRTRIRQPGTQTISSHFADPPEPAELPSEYHDPEKIVIGKTGELLMEAKHVYPQRQDVMAEPEMMNLSSGKAFVKSRVDCWMTFEQYDRLTRHLGKRYVNIGDEGVDPNAFWPGQLLDKMRLYMPSGKIPPSDCFFSTTKQHKPINPGYTNNGLKWWPVSDACYVKPADIEQHKKYSIDWK